MRVGSGLVGEYESCIPFGSAYFAFGLTIDGRLGAPDLSFTFNIPLRSAAPGGGDAARMLSLEGELASSGGGAAAPRFFNFTAPSIAPRPPPLASDECVSSS